MNFITEYLQFYVIPFLLFSTLVLIIILLFKRIRFEHSRPMRASIIHKAETFLTEMILSNTLDENFKTKLSLFKKEIPLHKSWCKEMLINDMIRFKMSLKGKASEQINIIYESFHLDTYSAGLIGKFKSFYKCEGFYHFQALDYKKGSALIKTYLKNPNPVIRSNANMAYISLCENHLGSLKDSQIKISYLNMIKIMDILHQKKIAIPKNIHRWLRINNNSVIKLGLKIMVFYNDRNQAKEVIRLVHDENDSLKKEAIITIRELFLIEAKTHLIQLFESTTIEIQLEILDTLKVIGDDSTIPFLENLILTETIKDVKLKAVECLNEIDQAKLNTLAAKDFDTMRMTKHIREIYL